MLEFKIMIAEVPVRIRCRHQETLDFLTPYLTDKKEAFTIEPTDADLQQIQAELIRTAEEKGQTAHTYSAPLLERSAVHALLAEKIVEHDVLLMHGSALCMDGQAYIFTAKSGTGKSTHTRLWREVFGQRVWMINDDKPMLRIRPDGITVWGTPWNGKHHLSRNTYAPLKAVVLIRRGKENHIEPLDRADAFPVIMAQAYNTKDPALAAKILKLEMQLLNSADFYTLYCNQEPEAACTAYKGITGLSGRGETYET